MPTDPNFPDMAPMAHKPCPPDLDEAVPPNELQVELSGLRLELTQLRDAVVLLGQLVHRAAGVADRVLAAQAADDQDGLVHISIRDPSAAGRAARATKQATVAETKPKVPVGWDEY